MDIVLHSAIPAEQLGSDQAGKESISELGGGGEKETPGGGSGAVASPPHAQNWTLEARAAVAVWIAPVVDVVGVKVKRSYRYRNPESRRVYMRDLMRKRRQK